jgi:hypothetical protein
MRNAVAVGVGGECAVGLACAGASVSQAGAVTPGTCATASDENGPCTVAPAGSIAAATGCLVGLICVGGRCVRPPASGACAMGVGVATCDPTQSYCDHNSMMCLALKANGASCQLGFECQSDNCINGSCAPGQRCDEK